MAKVDTKFALSLPKSTNLSFVGGKAQATQATGVDQGMGLPYICFYSGQTKAETRQLLMKGLPAGTMLDDGMAFLVTRDAVVLLNPATYMWAIEVYSTWAVQLPDGEVVKAAPDSFDAVTMPPKHEDKKKPGIVGRCVVAVLIDLGNGKLATTLATLRTTAGRLDGLQSLLKARELGTDKEWLAQNDKVKAYIPDEAAVFRAAVKISTPAIKAGKNVWTGFKGAIEVFPPKREYLDALTPVLNDNEMQRRCLEWWRQEVAELVAKGGQPPEAPQPAAGS